MLLRSTISGPSAAWWAGNLMVSAVFPLTALALIVVLNKVESDHGGGVVVGSHRSPNTK